MKQPARFAPHRRNELLLDECLKAIEAHSSLKNPINQQLLQQVAGPDATVQDYLYGGFGTSVGLRAALHSVGIRLYDCERVLDFGCGPARIIRWFADAREKVRLYGCDINPAAIEWCQANIAFAEFSVSPAWPPLPFSDETFDLLYGISVFTHLDEAMQVAWLEEISRVIKDEGIVLLTVHGDDKASKDISPVEYEEFLRNGFFYRTAHVKATVEGLPEFYQVAFHSERYVRAVWAQHFDVLGYITHACMYAQDLVVLRKKRQGERPALFSNPRLPLAALETPTIGNAVAASFLEEDFEIRGWAFNPDREPPAVELHLDGRSVGTCVPSNRHPRVLAAFPATGGAEYSGFSLSYSSRKLKRGWHVLWLTLKGDSMPLWATFFQCPTGPGYRFLARWVWQVRCRVRLRTRLRALLRRHHS
jgi:SAM-dependent methyltransferase